MLMYHVTTRWTGFVGSPGYTNTYFETTDPVGDGATAAVNAMVAFWQAVHSYFPAVVTVAVQPEVELINDADGVLNDIIVTAPTGVPAGTGGAVYSAPSGAVVNWRTAGIHRGHRVRGRTFLVPLANSSYDDSGTLVGAALAGIQTAAQGLVNSPGAPGFGVWARPSLLGPGAFFPAVSSSVPDKAAILRSRRD